MKRLMFLPSLALMAAIASGCKTQLMDSQGNPVYDASGNAVMVSGSTQEKVEKSAAATRSEVRAAIDAAVKSGGDIDGATISDDRIASLAGPEADEADKAAVKALAIAEAEKYKKENIYPIKVAEAKKVIDEKVNAYLAEAQFRPAAAYLEKCEGALSGIGDVDKAILEYAAEQKRSKVAEAYSKAIIEKASPAIEKLLEEGKYDMAREVLWRASTTGDADVDSKVRAWSVSQMHSVVNPAAWAAISSDIDSRTKAFADEKKFDEAIAFLKAYPRVRTYSVKIDEKLQAAESELVKAGVKPEDMEPVMKATGELVGIAEKIVDMTDSTTNSVTKIEGREVAAIAPDLEEYNRLLAEYKATLLKFDCTEKAAAGILEKFGGDVAPLIAALSKPATVEGAGIETKSFLLLGTGALNARIDKLAALRIAEVETAKKAHLAAVREAEVKAAIDALEAKVADLVASGDYAGAREAVWAATSTDDLDLNAKVRVAGAKLLLHKINPANWAAIDEEFKAKVAAAVESGSYDEAIEWAAAYPAIRTYAESIDAKLDDVAGEIAKLGVSEEAVAKITAETRKAAAEAERLVSRIDTLEGGESKAADLAELDKLLKAYRDTLVINDCTEANADALAAGVKNAVVPLLTVEKIEGSLVLGSNAVNKRLAALKAKTVEELKQLKYKSFFAALVEKVVVATKEGRFADARAAVRDVALVNDAVWDERICATRIGLLNSVVNPAQCAALLAEIDAKKKALFEAGEYEEFVEFANGYEYVHDTYEQIIDALGQIKSAMAGLEIADTDAGIYIDSLAARIRETMEKREGSYIDGKPLDLEELEKALAALEKGIVAQYYRPADVKAFCGAVKAEIVAMAERRPAPMTTWEVNEALRMRLAVYVEQTPALVEKRDADKLLAEIDAEISFDSQIAMAEDAIAKQLGRRRSKSCLKVNALLGEYARVMRLLKLGRKLDAAQATTMLLGAAYLDQEAVAGRALELGADVNGVSPRDPLARSAALLAIQSGHDAMLKSLSAKGAALDAADAEGNSALHYAVRRGKLSVVKAMLARNDVNRANKAGETAIFGAVRRNQAAIAAALVEAKADVNAKNAEGASVMDAACCAGSRDVLDVLADAGAEFGPAQLVIAAKKDRLAVAQWLVGKGVDVNAPGVMEATLCKSATQCYLVREGGIPQPCNCKPVCKCGADCKPCKCNAGDGKPCACKGGDDKSCKCGADAKDCACKGGDAKGCGK